MTPPRIVRARRRGPAVVPGEVLDARAQALRLLERAEADAARIREQARREGRAQADATLAAEHVALARAHAARLDELEQEALKVALLAAERIVGEALDADPTRGARMVRELLARVRRACQVRLRVNPADVAALEAARGALQASVAAEAPIEIDADPSIQRGGCVVHSDVGSLDARLEVQLDALARALGL